MICKKAYYCGTLTILKNQFIRLLFCETIYFTADAEQSMWKIHTRTFQSTKIDIDKALFYQGIYIAVFTSPARHLTLFVGFCWEFVSRRRLMNIDLADLDILKNDLSYNYIIFVLNFAQLPFKYF